MSKQVTKTISEAYKAGLQAIEEREKEDDNGRQTLRETELDKYRLNAESWVRNVLPLIARKCGYEKCAQYIVKHHDFVGYEAVPLDVLCDVLKAHGLYAQVFRLKVDTCGIRFTDQVTIARDKFRRVRQFERFLFIEFS